MARITIHKLFALLAVTLVSLIGAVVVGHPAAALTKYSAMDNAGKLDSYVRYYGLGQCYGEDSMQREIYFSKGRSLEDA